MKILESGLNFNGKLKPLDLNRVDTIVLHHAEHPTADFKDWHRWHLQRGYIGVGYNYGVMKDGTVYKLRGLTQGAQTGGHNSHTIGICFQGDYNAIDKVMPDVQFNSGVQLIKHLQAIVSKAKAIEGHMYFSKTECPGRYFPLNEMKSLKERGGLVVLKIGSRGEAVKTLQLRLIQLGFLSGGADGIFGNMTLTAVKAFQSASGLVSDGVVGKMTNDALAAFKQRTYIIKDIGKQVRIIKFKVSDLSLVDVIDSIGRTETVKSIHSRLHTKPDILINGGLFDTRTGGTLSKFVDDGKVITNGFYSHFSMVVRGANDIGFEHYDIWQKRGAWNVIGGSPSLVINGQVNIETKGLDYGFLNNRHPRLAIGMNDDHFFVVVVHGRRASLGHIGMTIKELALLCKQQGMTDAINLDGGGSIMILGSNGQPLNNPLETRKVDNAVAFYLR